MYLGIHGDRSVTIGEIASRHGISRNPVMKVVHELGQLGYLQTIRGKNGGIRLGRLPEQINVGRLVRETESNPELAECFGPAHHCRIASACVLNQQRKGRASGKSVSARVHLGRRRSLKKKT